LGVCQGFTAKTLRNARARILGILPGFLEPLQLWHSGNLPQAGRAKEMPSAASGGHAHALGVCRDECFCVVGHGLRDSVPRPLYRLALRRHRPVRAVGLPGGAEARENRHQLADHQSVFRNSHRRLDSDLQGAHQPQKGRNPRLDRGCHRHGLEGPARRFEKDWRIVKSDFPNPLRA